MSQRTAILLRVVGFLVDNLADSKVATTRDIYYQDVGLFGTQLRVQRAVERLCRLLEVPRRALNVVPSPNGLVAGDLSVVYDSGEVCELRHANGPSVIPVGTGIFHIIVKTRPEFVLVVEKEAVFTHLHASFPRAIIITGKGFPDNYTRKFLKALAFACPRTPVFGLVDADVHGILILRTYQAGGQRSLEKGDVVEDLQYLGVRITDYREGLVSCTIGDQKLAMSTLRKPWMHKPQFAEWRAELQRSMFMGKKAEMNVLDNEHLGRLATYVRNRVNAWTEEQAAGPRAVKTPTLIRHELSDEVQSHNSSRLPRSRSRMAAEMPLSRPPQLQQETAPRKRQRGEVEMCPVCETSTTGSWICCDACSEFVHLHCVAISRPVARRMATFVCPVCVNGRAANLAALISGPATDGPAKVKHVLKDLSETTAQRSDSTICPLIFEVDKKARASSSPKSENQRTISSSSARDQH